MNKLTCSCNCATSILGRMIFGMESKLSMNWMLQLYACFAFTKANLSGVRPRDHQNPESERESLPGTLRERREMGFRNERIRARFSCQPAALEGQFRRKAIIGGNGINFCCFLWDRNREPAESFDVTLSMGRHRCFTRRAREKARGSNS